MLGESDVLDCDTHDAKFEKGFMTRKDINGDGREDYTLDYGQFVCGGMHGMFCGSGGCTTTVFASSGSGYVKVLNET